MPFSVNNYENRTSEFGWTVRDQARGAQASARFYDLTDFNYLDRVKRIWYLSHMRAAKVQASLRIRAVSPEPPLLAHTSSESRGTFRQKARSLAPLNGRACAVKLCHDRMLEDTNSLDGAHLISSTDIGLHYVHCIHFCSCCCI